MEIKKIGFIGLGLIGGSIAKAIKQYHPQIQILAYMRNSEALETAKKDGTIDLVCTSVDRQFSDCDYIFLCAPVATNAGYLSILKEIIQDSCILTDVGSTKTDIHRKVQELGLEAHFIGGHPMAGSEKTGYANANRLLLENAYYILTPEKGVPSERIEEFQSFIASLKALPLRLNYEAHDFITASVSHLPHLIASSLVNLVQELDDEEAYMKRIAAGGFKDITRIASSSPEMWEQICMTNKTNIAKVLQIYIEKLSEIQQVLEKGEGASIYRLFETSRDYRNSIPDTSSGPIKKVYAFYCDMADEAGGIATLATILASNGINLKNIGIVHNREFEEAVLRVELYDEDSCEKAVTILRRYHYTVYEH